jgi:predicted O-linked N-acetylglucosamine transferase (SPINDLY family)
MDSLLELKNKALDMHMNNDFEGALLLYDEIIHHDPNNLFALNNSATLYASQSLWGKAKKIFERIIQIDPNNSSAYCNLGLYYKLNSSHKAEVSFKKAEQMFERAIEISNNPLASINLANIYYETKLFKKCIEVSEKAINQKKNIDTLTLIELHIYAYCSRLRLSLYDNMKMHYESIVKLMKSKMDLTKEPMLSAFNIQMIPYSNDFYTNYTKTVVSSERELLKHNLQPKTACRAHNCDSALGVSSRRIKVAYVSGDIRSHSVSLLMKGIFKNHNRDKVELVVFNTSYIADYVTEEIKGMCDKYYNILTNDSEELLIAIEKENVDVIIDLSGHTRHTAAYLFKQLSIPVRCHMVGYYGPLCIEGIDYFVGSSELIPESNRDFFEEKIIYMPEISHASPKFLGDDDVYNSKSSLGLPEDKFIFASFCNNYRIDYHTAAIWAKILKSCPNSILWLHLSEDCESFLQYFEKIGVSRSRIYNLEDKMLTSHKANRFVDIYLDPTTISAGTSTYISLSYGVPVLTLPSEKPESRTTTAILKAAGLDEFITSSKKEYVNKALHYYRNYTDLIKLKQKIINSRDTSIVFNQARFTYFLEKSLLAALDNFNSTGQHNDVCLDVKDMVPL